MSLLKTQNMSLLCVCVSGCVLMCVIIVCVCVCACVCVCGLCPQAGQRSSVAERVESWDERPRNEPRGERKGTQGGVREGRRWKKCVRRAKAEIKRCVRGGGEGMDDDDDEDNDVTTRIISLLVKVMQITTEND